MTLYLQFNQICQKNFKIFFEKRNLERRFEPENMFVTHKPWKDKSLRKIFCLFKKLLNVFWKTDFLKISGFMLKMQKNKTKQNKTKQKKKDRKKVIFFMPCFKTVDIFIKMKKAMNYSKFLSLLFGCCCKRWEKVHKTKY